jgi:hypothetical protein
LNDLEGRHAPALRRSAWGRGGVAGHTEKMRLLSLAVTAVALAACGAGGADEDRRRPGQSHARLAVLETIPMQVRGSRFRPHEGVKLVARGHATTIRNVRADAGGRFAIRLTLRERACGKVIALEAVGARGSRAATEVAMPDCEVRAD